MLATVVDFAFEFGLVWECGDFGLPSMTCAHNHMTWLEPSDRLSTPHNLD